MIERIHSHTHAWLRAKSNASEKHFADEEMKIIKMNLMMSCLIYEMECVMNSAFIHNNNLSNGKGALQIVSYVCLFVIYLFIWFLASLFFFISLADRAALLASHFVLCIIFYSPPSFRAQHLRRLCPVSVFLPSGVWLHLSLNLMVLTRERNIQPKDVRDAFAMCIATSKSQPRAALLLSLKGRRYSSPKWQLMKNYSRRSKTSEQYLLQNAYDA